MRWCVPPQHARLISGQRLHNIMTTYDVGILGNTNIDLIMGPLPHPPSLWA